MAVLKKLEDQLNCSICLDTYTNPKQLQCHHVYCQECLARLVVRNQQGQPILTCPNCRQVTPVPAGGVAGLQAAFRVNQLLEIVEEHKKTAIASPEEVKSASAGPTRASITVGCLEHGGKEVELYCETCGKTICWECIMKGNMHHSHEYDKLDKAFERCKREVMASLEPLEKQLISIESILRKFDTRRDEITDQQATIEADIHTTITKLQERLEARKTELIGQLHQLTQAKLKNLAAERDQIETTQAQLSSCLLFLKENLQTDNQGEALLKTGTTLKQVKKLTATFQPDMLEPNTQADMIFTTSVDLEAKSQKYGEIATKALPDPSKCYVTGTGVHFAEVGEKSTIVLHTLSENSQPSNESITAISCKMIADINGNITTGSVERLRQGQYEISNQPAARGKHQLHITVEDQHIKDSPFPVTVTSSVTKIRTPILKIDWVHAPEGVAVNQKGEVVVTQWGDHKIVVFTPNGQRIRSFDTPHLAFNRPTGIEVDGEGNLLVTDSYKHRILKLTAQGNLLKMVYNQGRGPLVLRYPRGIAVNPRNEKVYVVDYGYSRVLILNPDLSYYGAFGKRGSGKGQFANPWYIACDSTGSVYVADCNNHRVQVFSAEGEFLRMLGHQGELSGPTGIAIDSNDRVYVSEWKNCRVSVFERDGEFLMSFGSNGKGRGQFGCPRGIAVDKSGVVYVCDSEYSHIQVF